MLSAFIVKGLLSSKGAECQALPASTWLIFSDKTAAFLWYDLLSIPEAVVDG